MSSIVARVVVLPTGINLNKFNGPARDLRRELGIKKNNLVLVYAGLIVPRKGIDVMLKVVKRLNDPKIKLLLIGEGPAKDHFKQMTHRLKISQQVIFQGWRKDISDLFKSSDILILPSRGEGLPGIIIEAMACGLPVIASNIPCLPDLIEDKKTGFLCDINDVACFAQKIKELSQNHKKRILMGQKGKINIKNFEWNTLIEKYLVLYR